jgi:hypothetical protein
VTAPNPPIVMSRLPRGAIAELISALTVCDFAPTGWEVVWQTEPLPFEGLRNDTPGAYIELGVNSFRSIGVDDYRQQESDANPDVLESVFYGLRAFTLVLDCHSFAPSVPAWDILEGIRLQLCNPRSVTCRATWNAAGLAFLRAHPTVNLNYTGKGDVDNREISRSTMDVELSWLSAAQVVDDPGTTIGTMGDVPDDSPDGTANIPGTFSNTNG